MSKKINFRAMTKHGYDTQTKPYPAVQSVPQWWKDMTPYNSGSKKIAVDNRMSNASWKKCTPMLDAITSGYIIPLWTDIQIRQTNDGPFISWLQKDDVFQRHSYEADKINRPPGYGPEVFKYCNTWIPQTPPGYSIMVNSPAGYKDGPILAIPGIIDSDKSTLDFPPPVWIKEGFEGIVEKGTPLVQITPFKRENWESTFDYYEEDEFNKVLARGFDGTIINHYIKNHWSKKTYK